MDTSLANRDSFSALESPQAGACTRLAANNHKSLPNFALRPGNPYLIAMKSPYARLAQGLGAMPPRNIAHG